MARGVHGLGLKMGLINKWAGLELSIRNSKFGPNIFLSISFQKKKIYKYLFFLKRIKKKMKKR